MKRKRKLKFGSYKTCLEATQFRNKKLAQIVLKKIIKNL